MSSRIPSQHLELAFEARVIALWRALQTARRNKNAVSANLITNHLHALMDVRREARRDYVSKQNRSTSYFRQRQAEMAEEARDRNAEYLRDQHLGLGLL